MKEYLKLEDAANVLRLPAQNLFNWCKSGYFKYQTVDGEMWFRRDELIRDVQLFLNPIIGNPSDYLCLFYRRSDENGVKLELASVCHITETCNQGWVLIKTTTNKDLINALYHGLEKVDLDPFEVLAFSKKIEFDYLQEVTTSYMLNKRNELTSKSSTK